MDNQILAFAVWALTTTAQFVMGAVVMVVKLPPLLKVAIIARILVGWLSRR